VTIVRREQIGIRVFDDLAFGQLASLRRNYVVGLAALVLAGAGLAATRVGRGAFDNAFNSLSRAHPGWIAVAAACFALGLLASAAAWQTGLRACGGAACFTQVSARYAIGSLVNALAPAHLGGAVRLGLLSRTLPGEDRLWRAGGISASVAAARTLALAVVIVAAAAVGGVPLWPAPLLVLAVVVLLLFGRRFCRGATGRLGSFVEVFRSARRAGPTLLGWIACASAARIAAAVAIAMSFDVGRPLWVALVLLGAMAVSGILPLTPGNFGTGAGAATLALHGAGVGLGPAFAMGVAFQAVETFAGMTLGLAGAAVLATPGTALRRWSFAAAGVATIVIAAALGMSSVDLV
jgi:uncharacterized membrane protein YbhN (UPF0104 family)